MYGPMLLISHVSHIFQCRVGKNVEFYIFQSAGKAGYSLKTFTHIATGSPDLL